MHTKDMLAEELRKVGLTEMADRAATGYYHDFLSPLATPCLQLLTDLQEAREKRREESRGPIDDLINRHTNGDFDATREESDEWANSLDGKAAIEQLISGR